MDKSAFRYGGTAVPRPILFFFGIELGHDRRGLTLLFEGEEYPGVLGVGSLDRVRLFWRKGLDAVIRERFASENALYRSSEDVAFPPFIRFTRQAFDTYRVDLIPHAMVMQGPAPIPEDLVVATTRLEGERTSVVTTVQKRSQANRLDAIKCHGLACVVCGFDFGKIYGEIGRGFIEVHHVDPLSWAGGEREVCPQTDLVPVCSNCHRMLHRYADHVLSVEELKKMLNR